MKKIVIHNGFHPEVERVYNGEKIMKVLEERVQSARRLYLESGVWIKDLGQDRYITDWTDRERWGRVEEVETDEQTGQVLSRRDLGYMILIADREKNLL